MIYGGSDERRIVCCTLRRRRGSGNQFVRKPPPPDSVRYFLLCVLADARRYERKWWKHAGFYAAISYRTRWLRKRGPFYFTLLIPLDILLTLLRMFTSTCELPAGARIGPGLFLPHPDGVVLSDNCRIGAEVAIFQQVTIGYGRVSRRRFARVWRSSPAPRCSEKLSWDGAPSWAPTPW